MAEGNGVDLGSIYGLLVEIGKTVSRHDAIMERHGAMLVEMTREVGRMRSEMADLRKTVEGYHSTVVGHSILISEAGARVTRIERTLNLPSFFDS